MKSNTIRVALPVAALTTLAGCGLESPELGETSSALNGNFIPNGHPAKNPGGKGATFSTQGRVNLTGEYFQAQGSNGRSCATCHTPAEAWSLVPSTIQKLFDDSDGLHPIFNLLDANNPEMDISTIEARRAAYSMLLQRGVFRRGGAPRAGAEWELIAVEDPHGFANLTRIVQWRRVMPTINFHVGSATVNWDGGNTVGTDQRAGLVNQATRNVTGAQQGAPAPLEVINDIVDFESSLSTTQIIVPGVGRLDQCGAQGDPKLLSAQAKASDVGTCSTPGSGSRLAAAMIQKATSAELRSPAAKSSSMPRIRVAVHASAATTRSTTAPASTMCCSISAPLPPKPARPTCRSTRSGTGRRVKCAI